MKRVGVVYWQVEDGVATLNSGILDRLGYEPVDFLFDAQLPVKMDAILLQGPWGSMVPLANQLQAYPATCRPKLIWWLTEQLPNPDLPEWLRRGASILRSHLERFAHHQVNSGVWQIRPHMHFLTNKAYRFRYYGDLFGMRKSGLLTLVVVFSPITAEFLRKRGFKVFSPSSPSFYPEWGADLNMERDIPVLWIGKVATPRRRRLLEQIQAELLERGVELMRIDGEHHPYIHGDERTILLNRTKIVLNLLREKWDSNAMRFHFASLNKALIVTEPMLPHSRYTPGVHMVETPIENMADVILYYLTHEAERQLIVDQSYQLITKTNRQEVIAQVLGEAFGCE